MFFTLYLYQCIIGFENCFLVFVEIAIGVVYWVFLWDLLKIYQYGYEEETFVNVGSIVMYEWVIIDKNYTWISERIGDLIGKRMSEDGLCRLIF